jgi:hypothetical protein
MSSAEQDRRRQLLGVDFDVGLSILELDGGAGLGRGDAVGRDHLEVDGRPLRKLHGGQLDVRCRQGQRRKQDRRGGHQGSLGETGHGVSSSSLLANFNC